MNRSTVLGSLIAGLILLTYLPTTSVEGTGIGVLPPIMSLNINAGNTGSYQLKIHNGSGAQVTVSLSVTITQVPVEGSASDISLGFPRSVAASTGNTLVTVTMTVSPAAVPGTYILLNTVSFD